MERSLEEPVEGAKPLGVSEGMGMLLPPASAKVGPEHSEKQDSLRYDKSSHNQLT